MCMHVAGMSVCTSQVTSFSTILMLTVFSQCLAEVTVPVPGYERGRGFVITWFHLFKLFPVSNKSHVQIYTSSSYAIRR